MTRKLIGQEIEHYLIEGIVGEGGMGTVYRALDVNLARPVAMKVMHPNFAAQAQFQQRFQQEAQTAAKLDHPSIVRVYHFGREQGQLYIVMELVPGLSLGAYIKQLTDRNQIVRLDETVLLMAQVADALGYAHRKGVVHRDVKPDNIIVRKLDVAEPFDEGTPPLRAVVTDFGLAKLLEGGVQTQSGEFMGTLAYVSPEQVMDQPLDGRSDIYSLGVVLFQLATGRLPFDVRTPSDAVMKHLHQAPPRPQELQPGLPLELEEVILKALAKRPADRFQTGEELARALRQAAVSLDDQDVSSFVDSSGSSVVSIAVQLDELPEEVAPAESDPAHNTQVRGRDRLFVAQPGREPEIYSLYKREFTIGRSESNDIILKGNNVSRRHAYLERVGGVWYISDVGSTNGTFMSAQQLTPDVPVAWDQAQAVRIGNHLLHLQLAARRRNQPPDRRADTEPPQPVPAYGASAQRPQPQVVAAPRQVTAPPLEHVMADMRPKHLLSSGICRVLVLNRGDVRTTVSVSGRDPEGNVKFDETPKQITIAPGQKGVVDFYVEPRKRPFLGRMRTLPFTVHVNTEHREWDALSGAIDAHPPLAPWLWLLLLVTTPVFLVLLLFATGFLS